MLAACSRAASRAKCAFISQRQSHPKNPATLKFGVRGSLEKAVSLGRMCVYFAKNGIEHFLLDCDITKAEKKGEAAWTKHSKISVNLPINARQRSTLLQVADKWSQWA